MVAFAWEVSASIVDILINHVARMTSVKRASVVQTECVTTVEDAGNPAVKGTSVMKTTSVAPMVYAIHVDKRIVHVVKEKHVTKATFVSTMVGAASAEDLTNLAVRIIHATRVISVSPITCVTSVGAIRSRFVKETSATSVTSLAPTVCVTFTVADLMATHVVRVACVTRATFVSPMTNVTIVATTTRAARAMCALKATYVSQTACVTSAEDIRTPVVWEVSVMVVTDAVPMICVTAVDIVTDSAV